MYKKYKVELDALDILLLSSMAEARIEELTTLKRAEGEAGIPAMIADEMIEHYEHILVGLESKSGI